MNQPFLSPLVAILLGLFCAVPASVAEAPKIEHIIDLLQQAKDSSQPLPLLEKARTALKDFDPAPNKAKAALAGTGPRRNAANAANAANAVAAGEHKHKAMEAVQKAIEAAKSGEDVKPKVEHAIAMAHEAGSLKR